VSVLSRRVAGFVVARLVGALRGVACCVVLWFVAVVGGAWVVKDGGVVESGGGALGYAQEQMGAEVV
jgi:hypothetical protein